MKKKLLTLLCAVMVVGTYAIVANVQNSMLFQNALTFNNDQDQETPDEDGEGGGGKANCWSSFRGVNDLKASVLACHTCDTKMVLRL